MHFTKQKRTTFAVFMKFTASAFQRLKQKRDYIMATDGKTLFFLSLSHKKIKHCQNVTIESLDDQLITMLSGIRISNFK